MAQQENNLRRNARQTIIAAALFSIVVSPATADQLTSEQIEAINTVAAAEFAGEACPQFHSIAAARDRELAAVGVVYGSQEMRAQSSRASAGAGGEFDADPSDFCLKALMIFGPNGSHGHQLIEENKLTDAQHDAIYEALTAQIAGQRCEHFHFLDAAIEQELIESHAPAEIRMGDEYRKEAVIALAVADSTDQSEFCRQAWSLYGESGSYRRKMLEAN